MKLATLKNATRDGQLVVVSRDLLRYVPASDIAGSLQLALDEWERCESLLTALSDELNRNESIGAPFVQDDCHSPLPRAYQWADGSAYVNHVELVRRARGAEMPTSFWTDPLMYQGGSDTFLAPRSPITMPTTEWGIDMEGEVAVITGDLSFGATEEQAAQSIRLLMLVNDVSLRALIPSELAKGFGFFHSKPSCAFSPVAVTPDELGEAWRDGKLHRPLLVDYNDHALGRADAGIDMTFSFPTLIAHAAKSRGLGAGTIIGSGTVSNKMDGEPGKPIDQGGVGYSCIAEMRTIETINDGQPKTAFMQFGDTVRIRMEDNNGRCIFGEIFQRIEKADS